MKKLLVVLAGLFFYSKVDDSSKDQFCKHFNAWFAAYKSLPIDTSRISIDIDGDTKIDVINYQYIPKANGQEISIFALEGFSGIEQKPYFQSGPQPKEIFLNNCNKCGPLSEIALSHLENTLKIAERYQRVHELQSKLDKAAWNKINTKEQDQIVDEQLSLLKEIELLKKNS